MSFEETLREIVRAELGALEQRLRGVAGGSDDLITPAEAGEILRKKPKTIREMVRRKLLKRYGTSERVLVSRSEVVALATNPPPRARKMKAAKPETPAQVAERLAKDGH